MRKISHMVDKFRKEIFGDACKVDVALLVGLSKFVADKYFPYGEFDLTDVEDAIHGRIQWWKYDERKMALILVSFLEDCQQIVRKKDFDPGRIMNGGAVWEYASKYQSMGV